MKTLFARCLAGSLLTLLFLLNTRAAQAQAAVAMAQNGAYGFWYDAYDGQDAVNRAHDACAQYAGSGCWTVTWTHQDGHGAIALSTDAYGNRILGAAVGYASGQQARNRALIECRNRGGRQCSIQHAWYDAPN